MPTLNWIGKEKVVTHHNDVPFHVLEHKYTFAPENCPPSENMIIHGDNLVALKALLPKYEGKIKCIYIDPPYNTGNENWVYNDNVNDPRVRKWLGQIVGSEYEDLTRHDKWLCMMYPRLVLLQKLLSEDGVIFISIDDNEIANLKIICDEIFGTQNFVEIFSWVKTETPANLALKTKKAVEYIICYTKKKTSLKFKGLSKQSKSSNGLMNQTNIVHVLNFPENIVDTNLKDGIYKKGEYGTKAYNITLLQDTEVKNGFFIKPVILSGKFKWNQDYLIQSINEGTKISIKTIAFSPSYEKKEYQPEAPWNIINRSFGVDTNEIASAQLQEILPDCGFSFPKPYTLVKYLISFIDADIILDSFAGSGTTAHAVLNLNKEDGGNRKFILCEMCDYAETITAERVKRVIAGYGKGKNRVEGTGGSFGFYELGETIFDPITQNLNDNVDTEQIKQYIWFSETNSAYIEPSEGSHPFSLGSFKGNNYYFYYDRGSETCLDWDFLNTFTERDRAEMYIIYADCCLLTEEEMRKYNIVFKKLPRDVKRI